jgi:hypothetical protein
MKPTVTAVLDACVLYQAQLRDLFVELAYRKVILARWTAEIHREWIENLLSNRPDLDREKLERTRTLMDRVKSSLVGGHLDLVPSLVLPDLADRHVLAAAIVGRAEVIVTFNLVDFPRSILINHGVEAQHPDDFLLNILVAHEAAFLATTKVVRERLRNPPKTVEEYLSTLEAQGLARTVARLRRFADLI